MSFIDSISNVWQTWNRLGPAERDAMQDIVLASPSNALVLKAAKEDAEQWARSLAQCFTDGLPDAVVDARYRASIRNGPADAARHCYWSALLASRLTHNEALRVVFTHEYQQIDSPQAQDRLEAEMDLHNDRVGLEIGTRMKGGAELDLREAVLKALFTGQLRQIDPRTSRLVPTKSLIPST